MTPASLDETSLRRAVRILARRDPELAQIFRFELELMLEAAEFALTSVEGGHHGEPFKADSPHIFTRARRSRSIS